MSSPASVGERVIANIEALRHERRLSYRALSVALGKAGRPIWPSMVHALSQGQRRVDVDDLVALAEVLNVRPERLLITPDDAVAEDHPAVQASRHLGDLLVKFLTADGLDAVERAGGQVGRALRRVQLEVDELFAGEIP